MSVEERLEQTRLALAQMWSDEEATAERLQRLLLRIASEPDAPAVPNQQATPRAAVDPREEELALCPTCAKEATDQARLPPTIAPADIRISRPTADRCSDRVTELVERAQAGEADAFGGLYDQYSDTVYRYIYYRVGGKATAEDLTSETFLRALRRIGTFTWQGRDFGAWLVTIARNLVADHFKSSRFRLEVTTGEMLDAGEVERSPEDSVLESLSNAALLEAVRRLNPQQQECVTLRFLQGLSVAETARVMGKNEAGIKTLQHRAVRMLAQLLPDDTR
ncbi:ECF subfamily RNA polymerase sigma factor, BldN family [Streptomyces sp. CdTB01]|uniref:ECF subfamily RNA polymerase sigma factor, BldN family n=1 Tax=Streptomyces sp. CdTB01 TaxID=1725411 RepID=UPI001EEFEEE1|nr:ECF subfamily RNA polymerase sigma factor, BldN family [Streptomyces sp. CdTB01]